MKQLLSVFTVFAAVNAQSFYTNSTNLVQYFTTTVGNDTTVGFSGSVSVQITSTGENYLTTELVL